MPRPVFTYQVADISALARSIIKQWSEETAAPGHLQMLNMLSRAAGFQNFQHFRAEAQTAPTGPALPISSPSTADSTAPIALAVKRLLRHFDDTGRMIRWPTKFSEQQACLWPVWSRIPANRDLTEKEANAAIKLGECFGDHVLLRRELVSARLIQRTVDGRVYRRIEKAPPPEGRLLIREVQGRAVGAQP